MGADTTRGFPHYYALLGTGKERLFKHLRKTRITEWEIEKREGRINNVEDKTGHRKGTTVIQKHHVNQEKVVSRVRKKTAA